MVRLLLKKQADVAATIHRDGRLRFDASGAFFKIHTRVQLDWMGWGANLFFLERRDGCVSIFTFIPPERIRHLSFNAQPNQTPIGPNTVAL